MDPIFMNLHAQIQKIFSGEGGRVQIPIRGLTENFNMAKINNMAISEGSGPPVPPSGSAHDLKKKLTPWVIHTQCWGYIYMHAYDHYSQVYWYIILDLRWAFAGPLVLLVIISIVMVKQDHLLWAACASRQSF